MQAKSHYPLNSRRRFMQVLSGSVAWSLPNWSLAATGLWVPDELPVTPSQGQGPFYPEIEIEKQLHNDTDLYRKIEGHEAAKGEPIIVHGVVQDRHGKPLAGSVVEIWQACAAGRYNHSGDRNQKKLLDNNFQFWGRSVIGQDGTYSFTTVVPGLYPGRMGRHIHFRVESEGHSRLTTQCYFAEFGEDNAKDDLYKRLDSKEQELVTVELEKPTDQELPRTGEFRIVMA